MSEVVARRFVVSGRVQGVGFRAATRAEAVALGLNGHALNRADGSVEVVASGPEQRVEQLANWLTVGPVHANVENLTRDDYASDVPSGFRTG